MYRSESFRGGKFLTTMLHVSKTLRPHLTHKTLLACPSLPFITDSMNWHTYLLEPEISWGGGPEGGGKKDHCSVSRGYMTSAQLLTKTQRTQ